LNSAWGKNTENNRVGDPRDASIPGAYIGISYQFDVKKKIKGYQISFGFALPQFGSPGSGPYLFPGIAIGKRKISDHKKSYSYVDAQVVLIEGFWGGFGYGIAFMDGQKQRRAKTFGGYLLAGLTTEYMQTSKLELELETNLFIPYYHFGLALPFPGYHFYP
tara:strand:- start:5858 stop:6343 length:486 start_codon:yes stop_codon:yes gene_type:complete